MTLEKEQDNFSLYSQLNNSSSSTLLQPSLGNLHNTMSEHDPEEQINISSCKDKVTRSTWQNKTLRILPSVLFGVSVSLQLLLVVYLRKNKSTDPTSWTSTLQSHFSHALLAEVGGNIVWDLAASTAQICFNKRSGYLTNSWRLVAAVLPWPLVFVTYLYVTIRRR